MCKFTSEKTNLGTLDILANTANVPESSQYRQTSDFVRQETRRTRRDLKQVQKDANILREQDSAEIAKFSASLHNMDTKAAEAAIAARERAYKQRSVMKTGRSNGLDRIDVPNEYAVRRVGEEAPRTPLVTKEEISLLPRTEKRFGQHQETPFGTGERRRISGWTVLSRMRKHC
jgi:hypothetical protein